MYQLFNDDCFNIMSQIPNKTIDMICCDPPYGTTPLKWDSVLPFDKMWEQYNRIIKDNGCIALFSVQPFTTKLICSNFDNFKYHLIWKKNVPTGMNQAKYRPMRYHEEICIFNVTPQSTYNPIMKERIGKHKECYNYNHYCGESNHIKVDKIKKKYDPNFVQPSSILEFDVVPNRNGKLHPTQKPVELLEWLIKTYTNEGDLVLDNCMGSGSTGVACINTNRDFIGIELEKKYYDIAEKRIKDVSTVQ